MITVAGEALIDLVVDRSGSLVARPGGGPFNVARGVARLGGECRFLCRLSDDPFGRRLRAALDEDGVALALPDPVCAPTTLAIAQLDELGSAHYGFYTEGTSAMQLHPGDLPADLPASIELLALGGLGIVLEPIASTLHRLVSGLPPDAVVLLDPNCRPQATPDLEALRRRVGDFVTHADIIKASVEDLRLLDPERSPRDAARALLERGPVAVLVTAGPDPVTVHTREAEFGVEVRAVDVVDTIGAGDAFVAGFLTWWASMPRAKADLSDPRLLLEATTAAVELAADACTRAGADPPQASEWWSYAIAAQAL
jgi:fructokinase